MGFIKDLMSENGFDIIDIKTFARSEEYIFNYGGSSVRIILQTLKSRWWRDGLIKPALNKNVIDIPLYSALTMIDGFDGLKDYIKGYYLKNYMEELTVENPDVYRIKSMVDKQKDLASLKKDTPTLYIKTSPDQKHCGVITGEVVLASLKGELDKQKLIDKYTNQQKKCSYITNGGHIFAGNIWFRPLKKQHKRNSYSRHLLYLITGSLGNDNNTMWVKGVDVPAIVKSALKN